jgi:adenosylmethionine-8-amino-7-oxononanoate aminotransferase
MLTDTFAEQMRPMPTIPAPTAYRDRDNLSMAERGVKYADMLEEKIIAEGPESVVAFIMEPIGGAATAALVAPDSYYPRIREICDKYGILLIHDEVMGGVARTGKFLSGDHWHCRPDIVALSKGIGSGYMPLGAMAAPMRLVKPVLDMGGFQHGHTYAGNPLACAAGLAVMGEVDRLGLTENAAAMGEILIAGLLDLQKRYPFIGDVRGKGLLTGIEFVASQETMAPLPLSMNIGQRVIDRAYDRGLIVYSRRVSGGVQGDNLIVAPPLIVRPDQIQEILAILGEAVGVVAAELDLPVNG